MGERGRYAAEVAGSSPASPTIIFLGLLREPEIRSISAVTVATRDMARAVRFDEALSFPMAYDSARHWRYAHAKRPRHSTCGRSTGARGMERKSDEYGCQQASDRIDMNG